MIGLAATGNGNIPSFIATNSGTAPVVATIVVTPHFSNGGKMCDGPTKTFTITVNPTGEADQIQLPGVVAMERIPRQLLLQQRVPEELQPIPGQTTISVLVSLQVATEISPSFVATNPGTAPVVATIIVTPHFSNEGTDVRWPGEDITITVNPTGEVDLPASQVVCNGENTSVVTFTTTSTGGVTSYTWTNNNISIGSGCKWRWQYPFIRSHQPRHSTSNSNNHCHPALQQWRQDVRWTDEDIYHNSQSNRRG